MKLNCNRASLELALQVVGSVIRARTPKPILQNSKLVVAPGETVLIGTGPGGRNPLYGPDVDADGSSEILLPTSRMTAILRELREERISLELLRMPFGFARDTANFVCPWRTRLNSPTLFPSATRILLSSPERPCGK